MSIPTSSEAPFQIERMNTWSAEELAGWIATLTAISKFVVRPDGEDGRAPVFVKIAGKGSFAVGDRGAPTTADNLLRAAWHVHRTLWPKPAPKPIGRMTEECEFREQASLLNGYVETICFGALYVGVAYREGYGAATSGGCARRTDAFRVALRLLAQKHDRYDPTTDTITEATDD